MTTALSTGIRRAAARIAPDPAPDGELLSRFLAARDEAAFAVLVRRHAAMVFGTCRRVLGNAPDADDAFQAAFVVLVRKAHSLTDRACVGNFLYGVAFHTALKARAMATKRKAKEARVEIPLPTSTDSELTIILDEELARLPEKYREPVVLCELEGVSRRDAAGRLGVPEGTISSRLATAHRMLEKRLKARGFAAGITAALGGQAFAVSDQLADAAVRAAVSGPPAGVTHLAAEVTKMFLLTKLKVGTAVLAGVALLLGTGVGLIQRGTAADDKPGLKAPVPKKDEKDQDRIQGLWQAESLEAGGQKAPDEAAKGFQIRFKGTDITFVADDRTHTFELDSSAKPKAMNLTPGDGAAKGKKLGCAIYELDGDTLKICMDKEGQAGKRPAEFKTAPNDGLALIVLKRVKEEKKDEARKGGGENKSDDATAILGRWAEVSSAEFPPRVFAPTDKVFKGKNYWTFTDQGMLTNVATAAGETRTGERQYELKPGASPKELVTTTGGMKLSWSYELSGDTLKVALCGDGKVRPPSIDPKDIPQGVAVTVIEFTRVKEEKPAADKEYSLKEGEVLKLIPAPFPDARGDIYTKFDAARGIMPTPAADTRLMAVTVDKGKPVAAHAFTNRRTPGADADGKPLTGFLEHGLRIDLSKVSDPAGLLESTVLDADVVLKKGAAATDLLAALRTELKAKCGVDLVLEFRDAESEVVVISGKHTLNPTPFETNNPRLFDQASVIDLYATDKQEHANSLGANTRAFPGELAKFVGRPVIDESDLKTNTVLVKTVYHEQHPATAKTRAEDRDPAKVLKNLEAQTGLTFKLEKRKVRALVVEQPKKDDKPAVDKDYSLAAGEVLKLIPAPFPAGREKVFDRIPADKRTGSPADTNLLAVSVGDGSAEVSEFTARRWKAGDSVKPPQLLHYVKHLLGIDTATVSDPNWLLESTVLDADVVYRKGSKPDELLAALSRELKAKCGIDVTFAVREVETEVVVLGGKHTLTRKHAFPGRPYNDAARVALTDKPLAGSGGRRSAHLPAELATFVGRPVVDESDLTTNDVPVWITTPSYDTRPQAADRDPATALKRFAEQTGVSAKLEKRKVRAVVVDQPKQEPAWKAEFRKAYGLTDGQLIRRVAPPYPDCREDYLKDLYKGGTGSFPFAQQFAVFGWKGEWTDPQLGQFTMPVQPDEGVTLERLLDMTLKFPPTRIESDRTSLDRKVTGDWVVRTGADPEKAAVQLEAILRKELEVPMKFAFKDAEEEVFVLSGKYMAKPLDGKKDGHVEVYATYRNSGTTGGGGTGTLKELAAALERHVSKPVVLGKVEGGPKTVEWHFNDREKGFTRQEYEEDRHAPTVLGNVADQLGLAVTTEKRKVRTLVVEFAEVKK